MQHHPVAVAAPQSLSRANAPFLVERDDPDFVAAVLAELPTAAGQSRLASSRARARDRQQALKLYSPVQRRFHLALIEAWCETAGRPRVDPARVDAAGMVLRRVRGGREGRVLEGWMRAEGTLRGWLPVDRLGDEHSDPTPAVRLARKDTGVASIDRALRALSANHDASLLEEDVAPMFVAPPDVCKSAGATFYYGVVQTSSNELAQAEPDVESAFDGFGAESAAFRDHLVQPLRGQSYTFPTPPLSGRRFDKSWLDALLVASPTSNEHRFLQLLRQIVVEFDVFGTSAPARALHAQLQAIRLEYALLGGETQRRTVAAPDFLRNASRVLLEGESGTVEMPERWPALSTSATRELARGMSSAMQQRFKSVKGRPGRFDEPDAQYVLRAFVRMKPENGCPPRTVWSDYTEPFVIAPWWESAGDPVQVALPDLSNRELLKSLKPNVAFTLPPPLQNLMSGNPKDLMEGKGSTSGGITIGWICSFSIPVITFCAFIVLNIFLSLFDLIFRWMLFIKICIPYPKAK
jgi:hypothetical protein